MTAHRAEAAVEVEGVGGVDSVAEAAGVVRDRAEIGRRGTKAHAPRGLAGIREALFETIAAALPNDVSRLRDCLSSMSI